MLQITLNIDSENIGTTVEKVFETLTEDDKRDLAKQVMLDVLRNPVGAEREAYSRRLVESLLTRNKARGGYNCDDTAEKVRASYEYRQGMSNYKSSSERMVEQIVSSAIKHYTELVDSLVKTDPQIQEHWTTVRDKFVAEFPQLMQMTMATFFASQMGQIGQAYLQATCSQDRQTALVAQLNTAFEERGLPLFLK